MPIPSLIRNALHSAVAHRAAGRYLTNKLDDLLAAETDINSVEADVDTLQGQAVVAKEVTFTETAGAGTYTGSVTIPAGATVVNVIVHQAALWTAATSAAMEVGDATDPDGYFTAIDLKATDLLAGESVDFSKGGGKEGAYLAGGGTHWTSRYYSAGGVVSGIVTTVGATGNAGRTRMTVLYTTPTPVAATKA